MPEGPFNGLSACLCFRYQDELSLEDAIHTAILVLKEGYEGNMTSDSLEIGVLSMAPADKSSTAALPEFRDQARVPDFKILSDSEIADYLANL